jgi:molybdopterin molybdotransferase
MAEPGPRSLSDIASEVADYDATDLPVAAARDFLARLAPRPRAVETLPPGAALGRVLAEDVVSPIDVPAEDNSAMDGYAVRSAELPTRGEQVFRVAGRHRAGASLAAHAGPGECLRITTGASLPPDFDTVVPQELVRAVDTDHVAVEAARVRPGENRRRAGEDIARGSVVLAAGRRLRPADIGVLASLGRVEVRVFRRLRVAFASTGDELRSPGEPLVAGAIYDSNRPTLAAMLERLGVEGLDLGVVRDDPQALEAAFRTASGEADVLISAGGAGGGEADHTRRVLARLGEAVSWQVAMRPGRPMIVARIEVGACPVIAFGLPGNPVAMMVSFYALVRDALLAMTGATPSPLLTVRATSVETIRKRPGRTEYQRGIVTRVDGGGWQVSLTGPQGSGILRSMSEANGLIVLGHERGDVASGQPVEVLPFEGLA